MKALKSKAAKKPSKKEREKQVLLGLVEHYITTGQPVASNTLRAKGFESLSSATIRNYFMKLEKDGFLEQQHSSAGRIPTNAAYLLYAEEHASTSFDHGTYHKELEQLEQKDSPEINTYLQNAAELLSSLSGYPVFLSAPRFDHDIITSVKLVGIDTQRILCVIVTSFGLVKTELLHLDNTKEQVSPERLESYFQWRLANGEEPLHLKEQETLVAQELYNEVMVRYIVGYANFSNEDLYWTGFSELLQYPEFTDATKLASALAVFENPSCLRHLLRECSTSNQLKYWIGPQLSHISAPTKDCTALAFPYYINSNPVGAIGLLGPNRLPYKELFDLLQLFSKKISEALTKDVYKFEITFRQPATERVFIQDEETHIIEQASPILLEDKTQ